MMPANELSESLDAPDFMGYRRLRAWLLHRVTAGHDRLLQERKQVLFAGCEGRVVEIGPGSGSNLRYLNRNVQWTGFEPNLHLHRYVRREAERLGRPIDLRRTRAEKLELPDGSVDVVIGTAVLCSVEDVGSVLAEIHRVLRPGGKYLFIEHVAAPPGTSLRRLQGFVRPAWSCLAEGCQVNRNSLGFIEAAGFAEVSVERFDVPVPVVSPHIAGWARR